MWYIGWIQMRFDCGWKEKDQHRSHKFWSCPRYFKYYTTQVAPSCVKSGRELRNRLSQNWGHFWRNWKFPGNAPRAKIAKYAKSQRGSLQAAKNLTSIFSIYFAFHTILRNFPKNFKIFGIFVNFTVLKSKRGTLGKIFDKKIESCLELPETQSKLKK